MFFSTVVMPDALQAGWLSFSMFMIALSCVQPAPRQRWVLVGAGVAMGCCHLIRANDVILLPAGVAVVGILSGVWLAESRAALFRRCLTFLSGWAVVHLLEGLAYLWAADDFFHRFHVVSRHYGSLDSIARAGLNTDPRTIPFSLFAPLMWWRSGGWWQFNPDQAYHALLFCWALVSLVGASIALAVVSVRLGGSEHSDERRAARRIDRRGVAGLAAAAVWFAWPLLYHQFGSQSVTQFVPMHRLSRHLVVYAPGAIFATVAGCALLREVARGWRFTPARLPVFAVCAVLLLVHVHANWAGERIAYAGYHRIKGTYVRILAHLPPDLRTIVADPGDLCFFDFWLNPLGVEPVTMAAFARFDHCNEFPAGVVLTGSNPGWEGPGAPIIQDTVGCLPCLVEPPASWQPLYRGYPEQVYLTAGGANARP